MQVQKIPLEAIDVGNRLRLTDPDQVLFIASSVARDGIHSPIMVRPADEPGCYRLVTGAHRLEAARVAGLATIPATVEAVDDVEARQREIDENLYRYDLTALDRAVFLAEHNAIHQRLHPETQRGQHGRGSTGRYLPRMVHENELAKNFRMASAFAVDVRERLGLSERMVRIILRRATIPKDVRDRIAFHPIARNGAELDKLLKLSPEEQRAVIDRMLSGDPDAPATVQTATVELRGWREAQEKPEDELQLAEMHKAYRRAGVKAREQFLDILMADPKWGARIRALAERRAGLRGAGHHTA